MGHEVYVKFKAEVEAGLAGEKSDLKILRECHASDGEHGSALRTGASVIGLLAVVESDFIMGLAEAGAVEHTAAATYEQAQGE